MRTGSDEMNLSSTLKKRRKELNLTLLQIADKVGVSEATVQRWESGNIKSLRYNRISKLAEVLNISPAELMGWDEKNLTTTTSDEISPAGHEMLTILNNLDDDTQKKLLELARLYLNDLNRNKENQ